MALVLSFLLGKLNATDAALGIIHGDIKPENVLIFEDGPRLTAKVADFGFSTCFQSDDELISIPKSEPWNAPEVDRGGQLFSPSQAKQIDVYSFALLCTWLVIDTDPSTDSLPCSDTEKSDLSGVQQHQSAMDLFKLSKNDASNRLSRLAKEIVRQSKVLDDDTKDNLENFISFTLVLDPLLRTTNFEKLLCLLTPERHVPFISSIARRF